MDLLPIFLRLQGKPCLVVGGTEAAARKARLIAEAGAVLTIIAVDTVPLVHELVSAGRAQLIEHVATPDDLTGMHLVVAATEDDDFNAQVSGWAQARHLPVNVVDRPQHSSFIFPSIVDRSPLVAAVSTGGEAPVLARLMRARLETLIPASYGRLAALVGGFRHQVKQKLPSINARRRFWETVLQGPIAEMVYTGKEEAAQSAMERALADEAKRSPATGEVYLVGGGPGDPDLLTFRALRLMQQADVVLYDRLVAPAILNLTRRDAERIFVGKERDNHVMRQENINRLLVRLAKEGKRVLRLKGGDPFIFGRGGEEIDSLAQKQIPFQVVPGITAAAGSAAYAGIPLTHRDHAQSCIFVTGHLKDGSLDLNWPMLAQPNQTVVFYMGLRGLQIICRELLGQGMDPATPAALVEQATTPAQRVFAGTLDTLPDMVKEAGVHAPTLIIVGGVVSLHEQLQWFKPGEDGARSETAFNTVTHTREEAG